MTIDVNDWRLTAYALGELDDLNDADRDAVAAAIENSPAARAAVAEIRATASVLTAVPALVWVCRTHFTSVRARWIGACR